MPAVPLIGLTGAPAAGKTTVAAILQRAGCAVIDVDALGHAALTEPEIRASVADALGPGALREDGSVDRASVAKIAFRSPDALRQLERLVHPRVREMLSAEVAAARDAGTRAVVLDVALLFEGGLARICDVTVTVDAPREVRIRRASQRGWDDDELARREAQQFAPDEKRARADRVIVNDADLSRLRERTLAMLAAVSANGKTGR